MTANCTQGRFKGRGNKRRATECKQKGEWKRNRANERTARERFSGGSRDAKGRGELGKDTINNRQNRKAWRENEVIVCWTIREKSEGVKGKKCVSRGPGRRGPGVMSAY